MNGYPSFYPRIAFVAPSPGMFVSMAKTFLGTNVAKIRQATLSMHWWKKYTIAQVSNCPEMTCFVGFNIGIKQFLWIYFYHGKTNTPICCSANMGFSYLVHARYHGICKLNSAHIVDICILQNRASLSSMYICVCMCLFGHEEVVSITAHFWSIYSVMVVELGIKNYCWHFS